MHCRYHGTSMASPNAAGVAACDVVIGHSMGTIVALAQSMDRNEFRRAFAAATVLVASDSRLVISCSAFSFSGHTLHGPLFLVARHSHTLPAGRPQAEHDDLLQWHRFMGTWQLRHDASMDGMACPL